ncbi:MAG: flagellar motor protein MotB [Nitrospirales bacterium]
MLASVPCGFHDAALCLFVVMYSISSVNGSRFRTVSESMKAALNPVVSTASIAGPSTIGQKQ